MTKLETGSRRVVVGPKSALASRFIEISEVNWLGDLPFDERRTWDVEARIRSTRPPSPAIISPEGRGRATVELLEPEFGVSPGQACVFYSPGGTRLLGGGWIKGGSR